MGRQTEILQVVRDASGHIIEIKSEVAKLNERTADVPELIRSHTELRTEFNGHVNAHREKRKWLMALWAATGGLVAERVVHFFSRHAP